MYKYTPTPTPTPPPTAVVPGPKFPKCSKTTKMFKNAQNAPKHTKSSKTIKKAQKNEKNGNYVVREGAQKSTKRSHFPAWARTRLGAKNVTFSSVGAYAFKGVKTPPLSSFLEGKSGNITPTPYCSFGLPP